MSNKTPLTPTQKNARIARRLVLLTGGMVGAAFAAAPLYDMFCRTTGFGGKPLVAQSGDRPLLDRTVNVRFDANTDSALPWRFEPLQREVKVQLGEERLVHYRVTNVSQRPLVGTSTYNVTPESAGPWFNKLQCFCFTEQLLAAGESRDMPVRFIVDPELPAGVKTLTLSYTFFKNDARTAALSSARGPAANVRAAP